MKNTKKHTGQGRKKGSFSFVSMPLVELANKFPKLEISVPVSSKWAKNQGFDLKSAPAAEIIGKPEAVEVVVTDLNANV